MQLNTLKTTLLGLGILLSIQCPHLDRSRDVTDRQIQTQTRIRGMGVGMEDVEGVQTRAIPLGRTRQMTLSPMTRIPIPTQVQTSQLEAGTGYKSR